MVLIFYETAASEHFILQEATKKFDYVLSLTMMILEKESKP